MIIDLLQTSPQTQVLLSALEWQPSPLLLQESMPQLVGILESSQFAQLAGQLSPKF